MMKSRPARQRGRPSALRSAGTFATGAAAVCVEVSAAGVKAALDSQAIQSEDQLIKPLSPGNDPVVQRSDKRRLSAKARV